MAVTAGSAQAVTVANFTGGNSNVIVDAYQGTAGSGWQGGWIMNQTNTNSTGTVTNASPVNGGDNYLAMTSTTSGNGASATGWNRQYGGSGGGVSLSSTHTISWTFRVDETASSLSSNFNTGNDRYQFTGSNAAANTSAASNEWFVFSSGATPAPAGGNFAARKWEFYSGGATSAFGDGSIVDSGISLVSGTTYFFSITTDPSTRTYIGTVSDGTNSFTTGTLNWRNQVDNPASSGGFFTASITSSAAGETRSASLDSISIVPEPSSSLLLLGAAAILGTRRKRSH